MRPTVIMQSPAHETHEACILRSNGSWEYGLNGRMVMASMEIMNPMGCGSPFLYQPGFDFSALHWEIGKFLFSGPNHPSEVSEPSLVAKQFQLPSPRRETP